MRQRKRSLPYVIVIPGFLLVCFNVPCLYADHDTSLSTDLNFSYRYNEQFRAVSCVFVQINDDISNYECTELGIGLPYQTPLTRRSFLAYYQQGHSKDNDSHWLLEQIPDISLNTSTTLLRFKISNQIHYDYRLVPGWHDYRIKTRGKSLVRILFFNPISDESYFSDESNEDKKKL